MNWVLMESHSEIAMIGASWHFPGANNIDEFWRNLRDGVESNLHFDKQEFFESLAIFFMEQVPHGNL